MERDRAQQRRFIRQHKLLGFLPLGHLGGTALWYTGRGYLLAGIWIGWDLILSRRFSIELDSNKDQNRLCLYTHFFHFCASSIKSQSTVTNPNLLTKAAKTPLMPSTSPPPFEQYEELNSPTFLSVNLEPEFGSSYSPSYSPRKSPSSINHRGHGRHHSQQLPNHLYTDEDEKNLSYDIIKTYESGSSVLPTHSPSASVNYELSKLAAGGYSADSIPRSRSGGFGPPSPSLRRAVSGSFLHSQRSSISESNSGALGVEGMDRTPRRVASGNMRYSATSSKDKMDEKARLMAESEKRPIGSARYAKLIPEQQPPRLPVSQGANYYR